MGALEGDITLVTLGGTAHPECLIPATTTQDALVVGVRCRPRGIDLRSIGIQAIPVASPLINIASHIVDGQLVGKRGPDRMGSVATMALVPSHLINVVTTDMS